MIKFSRTAANQYLSSPDNAALTYPNSDWSLGWVMTVDGLTTGDNPQYLFSNDVFQAAGSLQVAYGGAATSAYPNKVAVYFGTSTGVKISSTTTTTSGSRLWVLQRSAGVLSLRSCPILASAPSDGSAVVAEGSTAAIATALDGAAGQFIGARSDLLAARFNDQSLSRAFRFDGVLTNAEVAQLAYGKQITEIGKTPAWYLKMETSSDITNLGNSGNVFTKTGTPTTTTEPAYGWTGGGGDVAPAFTVAPSIIGTPQVGIATAFTSGAVSGTPTPTLTQQWTLDGVDISGATGSTYTPVVGDVGKALRVRQIATNTAGNANSTSAPVTVIAAAAVGTVDVTDVTQNAIFPRASGAATIPLSGVYTGTAPATIEAQIYAADGVTVLSAWSAVTSPLITGGTWVGNRSVPQGGMYRIAVRSKDIGGAVIATSSIKTNLWAVGALIAFIGSSSSEKPFNSDSGTGKTALATVRKYNESGWQTMGTVGAAIDFANAMTTQLGVPVGLLDYGIGGTTLAQWVTPGYAGFTAFAAGVSAVGGKLEAVYSSVGSNDAATGVVVSQSAHAANLNLLASNTKTMLGQPNVKWIGSGTNGRTSANNQQFDWVREAEKAVFSQTNFSYTQTLDFPVSGDNVHLTTAGFTSSLLRSAAILAPVLLGTTPRKGPRITAITYSGAVATLTIALGAGATDFTPTLGITGITASDTNGALTILSAVRIDAEEVQVTFNRAVVGTLNFDYLAGSRPTVSAAVLDNGTVPLPLELETLMAATPVVVVPPEYVVRLEGVVQVIDAGFVLGDPESGSVVPVLIGNKVRLLRPDQFIQ